MRESTVVSQFRRCQELQREKEIAKAREEGRERPDDSTFSEGRDVHFHAPHPTSLPLFQVMGDQTETPLSFSPWLFPISLSLISR